MASWLRRRRTQPEGQDAPRRRRRPLLELSVGIIVALVFLVKIFAYIDPAAFSPSSIVRTMSLAYHNSISFVDNLPFLNSCPSELQMHDVSGGYVCISSSAIGSYKGIYDSYPLVGRGIESIYSSEDQGSVSAANDLLQNKFDIPGYPPVQLSSLPTWSENYYSASNWRAGFYSLDPSLNLLYAYRTTGNVAYARKLVSLDVSFIASADKSQWAWSDPQAVAFRSMALVDTWWKLRQAHQLPESASSAILGELEKTGVFLADPNYYHQEDTDSVNEAAALYELAVAFPTLPNAHSWLTLAAQRFQWQLDGFVDSDGEIIENSPYYEFYVLSKYWQIYDYSLAHDAPISSDFYSRLQSMLNFATYILQPNSQVPLLGASIETAINDYGVYEQMAAADPPLRYVLTQGAKGTAPADQSVYFAASGLTVMRSGWPSGSAFPLSTYLTYNIGNYRTSSSDLDALAITLYGDGGDLLPGAGLYTYQSGPYRDYFHGTESENTVVVDGKSQAQGNGTGTQLVTKDGLTYQSAESSLYNGVSHERLVMMIDPDHLLVVDQLKSSSVHTYQQMFHLFPGAELSRSGLTVSGSGGTPDRQVTIQQLQPAGITESDVINQRGTHPAGLCSEQYGVLLPCYQISYSKRGQDATFVTLVTIGSQPSTKVSVTVSAGGQHLGIVDGQRQLNLSLGESAAQPERAWATDPTPPPVKAALVRASEVAADWTSIGGGVLSFGHSKAEGPDLITSLTTSSGAPVYLRNDAIHLDLSGHNARLRLQVDGLARIGALRLILSNDDWARTATMYLADAYTPTESGDWFNVFIGPSASWGTAGGWTSDPGFNWSEIDGLEIKMDASSSQGGQFTVSLAGLSLIPAQREGKVVFIFDDGYQSILPAASYLHQNGMAGNVAVIGKYSDYPTLDHLNLDQLKFLQNDWGWDMVNHTQHHVDAVLTYYDHHDYTGYANDILQQAAWLEANGLNSAPNWLIYPHGDTNAQLQGVVGKYYMFARGVANDPTAYPYGDPLLVSNLEIQYPGDEGEGGSPGLTTPAGIQTAVNQAVKYHMTLLLTFHRIYSQPGDLPGYPLTLFKQIVNEIRKSGIKVMTLSQLDRSNGVPVNNHIYYQPAQPSQITVTIGG
jgi:hypothetical protein